MNKHKKVEELIRKKIALLDQKKNKSNEDSKELEKFKTLYRLVTNQYESFLEQINMDIAIAILEDIGIPQDEVLSMYNALMREEMDKKYILMDINIEDKSNLEEEEER